MRPVLTAAEMREIDRRTIELGIPGIILMENAGLRVVEILAAKFAPLASHRIVVVCGKGNNGGDGLVIARQLFTRFQPAALHVVLPFDPDAFKGDAAENFAMMQACGCPISRDFPANAASASLVIDALLGTGLEGPARGPALEAIRYINANFPVASVIAVDIPSGLTGGEGEYVRAGLTVTFTALKTPHATLPACNRMGEIHLVPIGTPASLLEKFALAEIEPADFRHLLAPRPRDSNKGKYGHILVIAGARGRAGAACMSGIAGLRAGAGLVTVATAKSAQPQVAAYAPELMTLGLEETPQGAIADQEISIGRETLIAIGPGIGTDAPAAALVRRLFHEAAVPMVVDADALNCLKAAGSDDGDWRGGAHLRVLTPHPGEMSRLTGLAVSAIQAARVETARAFATSRQVVLVLKGERTLIAFPDGRVWINPTGSPGMATGGAGDILTGLVAGFLAQFPREPELAIACAVYLHGLAGSLGSARLTEQALLATDLLTFLPGAIHACASPPHPL